MSDRPFPPPLGFPSGPSRTTAALLTEFLDGASQGFSRDAQVEGTVLMVGLEPLAIRLDGAMLVRDHASEHAAEIRAAVCEALTASGMQCVERDTPLALIVEAEVFARRGYRWGLWAPDPDQGRAALAERAAPDMPGILDADRERQREQARIDAVISELEDDL